MRVAQTAIAEWGLNAGDVYLAQGTLRPDLIESSSSTVSSVADVIKTHHNDTELVRALRDAGRVVEPLRDYHKVSTKLPWFCFTPTRMKCANWAKVLVSLRNLCGDSLFLVPDLL